MVLACLATLMPAAAVEPDPPEALAAEIAQIQDFTLNFDHPGFEAVLLHVARHPPPVDPPPTLANWLDLVERPQAKRGHWITVEGNIGRNSSWRYADGPSAELGELAQLELHNPRQPLAATVIMLQSADNLPRGTWVRVTGRFVMVRKYLSATGNERFALLLVAHGPTDVALQASRPVGTGDNTRGLVWLGALALLMVVAWRMVRRRTAEQLRAAMAREAAPRAAAPFSVAEDAARWAAEERPLRQTSPESRNNEDNSSTRT